MREGFAPLGGYAARSCPVVTQWDIVRPAEPASASAFFAGLGEAGVSFEATVFEQLARLHPSVAWIAEDVRRSERAGLTSEAMDAGVELILGGRLPVDHLGGRVAHPDVLVRNGSEPVDGRWRYLAVDVKHHATLVDSDKGAEVVVHDLADLGSPDGAETEPVGRRDSTTKKDLLQLAHYQRTLGACGHAAPGPVWAGVLGREGAIAWYRLDVPAWQHRASDGTDLPDATTLEVYDHEFAHRRTVAEAATSYLHDPKVPLPVQPVRIGDCEQCRWRLHCGQLLTDRQDVSLLPAVDLALWRQLHDVGLDTIPALAYWEDLDQVDDVDEGRLQRAADEARAYLGPQLAYLRRGIQRLDVPRADVEIDVDMENVEGGAYLWGVWVTDRTGLGIAVGGYQAFVDWNPDPAQAGIAAFERFWSWLQQLRHQCRAAGVSVAAYCWSASAENTWLRTGGQHLDLADEVETFIDSAEWIDLLAVFRDQLVTGHGNGLKTVATRLGFAWQDHDPGGAQSMQWWQDAVDQTLPPTSGNYSGSGCCSTTATTSPPPSTSATGSTPQTT
ncbi:TM0106 family RecB-like putative nuclease [Egicoccus halophilus]|uniref:TM0106 family RecB-like putative nuclease n=1 Tax=Egicoccus halophilus TaxID=1670830 RepID=UPI001030AA2E|nr:TM0106 family RecB-like putative nuclease [Egicoccus halophilus]